MRSHQKLKLVMFSGSGKTKFTRTWKSADTHPPSEGGRYWCLVAEINDLGTSHFQWNCSYHPKEKRWSDNFETMRVIYWTELAPLPEIK